MFDSGLVERSAVVYNLLRSDASFVVLNRFGRWS